VQYRVARSLIPMLFSPIKSRPPGWHVLATTAQSGALDYVRSPLLLPSAWWYPPWFAEWLRRLFGWYRPQPAWTSSTGDNAPMPAYQALIAPLINSARRIRIVPLILLVA
jgi:hypothetical protein